MIKTSHSVANSLSILALTLFFLAGFSSCGQVDDAVKKEVDSLNMMSYEIRYTSIKKSKQYAQEAIDKYSDSGYKDGIYLAWGNLGYAYYMQMRYDSVMVCSKYVLDNSRNDLICAISDINMMLTCNMTGHSKEFYEYRTDAQERLDRVEKESEAMTDYQTMLWRSTQARFHLASLRYFLRMRLNDAANESSQWLEGNTHLFFDDPSLKASYLMHRSMLNVFDKEKEDKLTFSRRTLFQLFQNSAANNYTYLIGEAANRLARTIIRDGELTQTQKVLAQEFMQMEDVDSIGEVLAERSLELFEEYGNKYTICRALQVLSEYKVRDGKYEDALQLLEKALQLINVHHRELNSQHNHLMAHNSDTLYTYSIIEDTLSTEMEWIADEGIISVPSMMAGVREQLSIVYGAMGKKAESDYNHNIYFDIHDATRQDMRVLQEEERLYNDERMLNVLIYVFVIVLVILGFVLYFFNKRSQMQYKQQVNKLSHVIDICRNMSQALSEDIEDESDLDSTLHQLTDNDVKTLFPMIGNDCKDWTMAELRHMNGMDKEMFNVLLVFYRWMKEKGMMYITFAEEERRLESETYLLEKRFEESKKQYLEKLTSMSIVNGITPFLDRALHEVAKLKDENGERTKERFEYVCELIGKINEYNDVLGHWVKIRRGIVTLNVENFELQPLLETLKLGAKTFANKSIDLEIGDSSLVVKADKSLTLFMMNTLLDNARKYTPEGGMVKLTTEDMGECVEISIQDTGHGMSEADVETINGSKVYDSSKIGADGENAEEVKKQKGFGFGLMNCKGIIEQYRKTNAVFSVCQFGVESTIGKGSRFFFRLPKGVVKAVTMLLAIFTLCSCDAERIQNDEEQDEVFVNEDEMLDQAEYYVDCVFSENVEHNYEMALVYADSAIDRLNAYYLKSHPGSSKLMKLSEGEMAEVEWLKEGFDTNYDIIITVRNEVAISALALNRSKLYLYNSEAFTRLYQIASTDDAMEEYCNSIKQANRDKRAILIMLGVLIFSVLVVYFFLHYRHYQLFIFNLRQFIQLNNNVFSAPNDKLQEVLHQSLSDIKLTDRVELSFDKPSFAEQMEMKTWKGNLRMYPLTVKTASEEVNAGTMTVLFRDQKLTDDEELIIDLVRQFIAIHTYFSFLKVGARNTLLELKEDERKKIEVEQQRVYVQNMIMDNCMSTLKHETMYYPNRIKQIIDKALVDGDLNEKISDVDELLTYYKQVFNILSSCAGKQVERVLFKRSTIQVALLGDMVSKSFKKVCKKNRSTARLTVGTAHGMKVLGDKVFLQVLIDNVLSLYFEHNSGGDLSLDYEEADGFVKFIFTDPLYSYIEDEIPNLFYVDNVKYDAKSDELKGMQYLLAKQIVREHDQYSHRRGCRIYVENIKDGGSRFVFTIPKA